MLFMISFIHLQHHLRRPLSTAAAAHFVFCRDSNKFVQVKDFKHAEPTKTKKNIYYCLITDTHKIPIEQFIFWDWEDDILTLPAILCPLYFAHYSKQLLVEIDVNESI